MRRWSLLGGWLLALIVTTVLTWQIVSAADDRVSERPLTPLNVDAPVLAVLDPTSTIPLTPPDQTATTLAGTSTTIPSVTTTVRSTTPPTTPGWKVKTVPTKGGTVVVKYRPDEVVLQTATPAPGFSAEVEDGGPPTVDVSFQSEDQSIEIDIEHAEGKLEVDVSESEAEG